MTIERCGWLPPMISLELLSGPTPPSPLLLPRRRPYSALARPRPTPLACLHRQSCTSTVCLNMQGTGSTCGSSCACTWSLSASSRLPWSWSGIALHIQVWPAPYTSCCCSAPIDVYRKFHVTFQALVSVCLHRFTDQDLLVCSCLRSSPDRQRPVLIAERIFVCPFLLNY